MVASVIEIEKGQAVKSLLTNLMADRAFAFKTYKLHKLGTVGTGYVAPREWNGSSDWDAAAASAFARMFDRQLDNKIAAARGKAIFVQPATPGRKPTVTCFQIKGRDASPAFCGNATAAGAVIHAQLVGDDRITVEVIAGARSAQVYAQVKLGDAAAEVDQTWRVGEQTVVDEIRFEGRKAVVCSFLNDYLILAGPLPFDPVTVLQSASSPVRGLSAKLVVIEKSRPVARVSFFNCHKQHGGAPQTGLATLAFAAFRVPWVSELLEGRTIRHPGGVERLPSVELSEQGIVSVAMPRVEVQFSPLLGSSI